MKSRGGVKILCKFVKIEITMKSKCDEKVKYAKSLNLI